MAGIVTSAANVYNSRLFSCLCKLKSSTCILNSGASDHMSYDLEALDDLQFLRQPLSVTLPNGHKVLVKQYRKLQLSDDLVLNPVL